MSWNSRELISFCSLLTHAHNDHDAVPLLLLLLLLFFCFVLFKTFRSCRKKSTKNCFSDFLYFFVRLNLFFFHHFFFFSFFFYLTEEMNEIIVLVFYSVMFEVYVYVTCSYFASRRKLTRRKVYSETIHEVNTVIITA